MCKIRLMTVALLMALLVGCGHAETPGAESVQPAFILTGDAAILQSWSGEFPVVRLDQLPADQREQGIGYIGDQAVFEKVWTAFKPGKAVPTVDFQNHLVFFVRNTRYFNRISIGKIMVTDGIAEMLAMETMSAIPIEDQVAMALVVTARKGITGLRVGSTVIPIE